MALGPKNDAASQKARHLYVYNGGFLTQSRLRRILGLSGYQVKIGKPAPDDLIGLWGNSPTAHRGEVIANHTGANVVRVEDAFLRSVLTGREGDSPLGLNIDSNGVHFDPSTKSDLERLLLEHPLDDSALLARARSGIERLRTAHLSKYNAFDLTLAPIDPGYVIVVDQTRGDASVKASGADANTFKEMLYYAQTEHPLARIIIKTHPETTAGHRQGYFTDQDTNDRISLCDAPYSPYALFDGAIAVYTVSSQMGFEAILTGHKPVVFGQPFYSGWGLSDDRTPLTRRQRKLTRNQLFAAAMLHFPTWYAPYRGQLCSFEQVCDTLEAQSRAWRDDHLGWAAHGMRLWKRKPLQQFFGRYRPVSFRGGKSPQRHMVWGTAPSPDTTDVHRLEDGFLRSRGLGADLIPPLSLVLDDIGLYYDPSSPSRLETLIAQSVRLSPSSRQRAERLIDSIIAAGLSKYNLTQNAALPDIPSDRRAILVVGQVEDDASILRGTQDITTNADLLTAARAAHPDAFIIYKPHPDVEAGLRSGAVTDTSAADHVLLHTDPIRALDAIDHVWTMTSLLGFEALLRGKQVTCAGQPFYAGWGLTHDLGDPISRRTPRPDLIAMAHATLIAYPRYFDPKTGLPCPAEIAVERLITDDLPRHGRGNRLLAKAQGLLASYAHIWR